MTRSSPILRCAIYTRKSSEEGLEQSFNSLHAQREACEAYIKSQAHEGWDCCPELYDDGGFSGGSMERPGLTALMADIDRGRIDVVVVYKVDRLTRSLMDFAKIVDNFDRRQVSFVSVTQAFNTTTSMGRLTLNVLLSFAQFEREVTGERIRDKIAASKKKGLWMGGNLPLGYDRKDNTLVVNSAEAEMVREIFERYLEIGSVGRLRHELANRNIKSKCRVTRKGETVGGINFSRGALYHLLSNHHYRGLIRHKDELYAGLHEAIVEEPLFDAVQAKLLEQRTLQHSRTTRPARLRLAGRIIADGGRLFTPSFGYGRGQQPYRYYVVPADVADDAAGGVFPHRLPAGPVEEFVEATLRRLQGNREADWSMLDALLVRMEVFASETHLVLDAAKLFGAEHPSLGLEALQRRLKAEERALVEPGASKLLRVVVNRRLSFRGGRAWMLDQSDDRRPRIDPVLLAGLKNAHSILADEGIDPQMRRYARDSKSPVHPYQRKLCLLALLSPELQVAVIEGRTPKSLTLHDLVSGAAPPLLWREQQAWMFARHPGE